MDKKQRQLALLQAIIQEYIKTAKPVGSKALAEEHAFDCSSATIRNDMTALEDEGYIMQPHTSAGRVPTEQGYQFYIENFMHQKELNRRQRETLDSAADRQTLDVADRMKRMAKTVADMTNEAVIVSIGPHNYFYTGISHLFRKPEFAEMEMVMAMNELFEDMDKMRGMLDDIMSDDISVMIGHDNPFSANCAFLASKYLLNEDAVGMMGILGPMRMDYDTNLAILEYMESLIAEEDER
ncbi:MAG: HTH domain-containing protein [Candidatus Kerfeldbacteria bacterium]